MKRLITLLAAISAACARPTAFVEYREPGGEFSVQVPAGWTLDERGPFSRKPVAEVWWVGETEDQHEGLPIGALLYVRRLDRHPEKNQERYRRGSLEATEALFAGTQPREVDVKSGDLAGYPARWFQRSFEESLGGGLHGRIRLHPSKVAGVVVQTESAYYVLEYKATQKLFDKHFPAFQQMTASFRLLKAPK